MITETREDERKYDVDPDATTPELGDVTGVASHTEPTCHDLTAVYFDTENLDLSRARITLRRRTGGEDPGWHLKLPEGKDTRTELRLPLDASPDPRHVPPELSELVLACAHRAPLVPVARITTRRTSQDLVDSAGHRLAQVVMDDVTGEDYGRPDEPTTWREIEVELTDGDPELLDAVDARLRATGAHPATTASKLQRVLGRRLFTVDGESRGPLTAYLRTQLDAIVELDPRARRDEPDAVHRMRVATRRARSVLQTFHPVFPAERATHLIGELRWLGVELGGPRDREVLRDRLHALMADLPPQAVVGPIRERLTTELVGEQRTAMHTLRATLNGDRYVQLLADLDALLREPVEEPGRRALAAAARQTFRRLRHAIELAERMSGAFRDSALHDARKAAKRMRYVSEALADPLGHKAARFVTAMRQVQELLGDRQDTVVSRGVLLEIATRAHEAGEPTFSYGVLYQREADRAAKLEGRLPRLWRQVSRPRRRYW